MNNVGKKCLHFPLTTRVLFAVPDLPLAVLSPLGWLLGLDWKEAGLDMGKVMSLYLSPLPLDEVE